MDLFAQQKLTFWVAKFIPSCICEPQILKRVSPMSAFGAVSFEKAILFNCKASKTREREREKRLLNLLALA